MCEDRKDCKGGTCVSSGSAESTDASSFDVSAYPSSASGDAGSAGYSSATHQGTSVDSDVSSSSSDITPVEFNIDPVLNGHSSDDVDSNRRVTSRHGTSIRLRSPPNGIVLEAINKVTISKSVGACGTSDIIKNGGLKECSYDRLLTSKPSNDSVIGAEEGDFDDLPSNLSPESRTDVKMLANEGGCSGIFSSTSTTTDDSAGCGSSTTKSSRQPSGNMSPVSMDSGVHVLNGDGYLSTPLTPEQMPSPNAAGDGNFADESDDSRGKQLSGGRGKANDSSMTDAVVNTRGRQGTKHAPDVTNVETAGEVTLGDANVIGTVTTADDVFFIQDTAFTIKVIASGTEPFDLQVSAMELVQEIHQVLMDREETCHRTCFSLQFNGVVLENFTELKNIVGLGEGSVVKVVEEAYTVREARIHLRHVRDLIKALDPTDAYVGNDGASLSFLNHISNVNVTERRKMKLENSVDCTPPDYIMPAGKDRPLTPLMPISKEFVNIPCLKVLSISGWNPPPGNRKMRGDLMYLYVLTLEDKRYNITACTKGFYVNLSTEDEFNPRAANQKFIHHSLIDLLTSISPCFKKNFGIVQKKRCQKHPFERVVTPYQVYSWTAPCAEHTNDSIRAEDAFSFKLGYEEHIPGQTREWNEELQTTRELPRKTMPERLLRERAIFKVHSDFVSAAARGAVAVIDGNVMAINPGEDTKMQMFIWNNIFFSLGFDVKDHYKDYGGDAAAYVAPSMDLQGVKAYFAVDPEGLYVLGTVVVDYRGYRLTAQSIIPGILERDQEQSVVYGSFDFGKTVLSCEKYEELLEKSAQKLKILPHTVKSEKNGDAKLFSSYETKGIIGNDSRHYILDLLRTFPPDVNYLEDAKVTEICKQNGFPRKHRHKLACLRQELIEAFVESRYVAFIKIAAYHLQQLRLKQLSQPNSKNKGDATDENEDGKDADKSSKSANSSTNFTENSNDDITESQPITDRMDNSDNIVDQSELVNGLHVDDILANDKSEDCAINGGKESSPSSRRRSRNSDGSPTTKASDRASCNSCGLPGMPANRDFLQSSGPADVGEETTRITKEIKRKITREESPEKESNLPEADEAKRIVDSFVEDNCADGQEKEGSTDLSDKSISVSAKEIIKKAAAAVGSLSDDEFDIRFNPDCFCSTVVHAEGEELERQRVLVREAAQYLLASQIPSFIRECLEHSVSILDGISLVEALHTRGINIRYLGKIVEFIDTLPMLDYVRAICLVEIICRSAKHVFALYLQSVEQACLSLSVSHFLNCLVGSCPAPSVNAPEVDALIRNRKNNKRQKKTSVNSEKIAVSSANCAAGGATSNGAINGSSNGSGGGGSSGNGGTLGVNDKEHSDWCALTPKLLWDQICTESETYYGFKIDELSIGNFLEDNGVQKMSILRRFCTIVGIQLRLRDFNLDSRSQGPFSEDDINTMFPIVKHIHPKATDACSFYTTGQNKIQAGQLRSGYELVTEALNLLNNVYGALHPEIAQCLRLLARLSYILGDHQEALAQQLKAVMMSERCNGIDHPQTILEYTHMALYCFANWQISTALKLLYRARYLMLLAHGENHPHVALLDSNIGLILHAVVEYDLAVKFLENALRLNQKYFGASSLKVALSFHLIARTQSCRGDFRTALQCEKQTFSIYKKSLGESHEKTRESGDCLRHLTQQAVTMQKRMNEITRNAGSLSQLLPLHIQQPSFASVLEVLNVVNGIVFIQISAKEIDELRSEMSKTSMSSSVSGLSSLSGIYAKADKEVKESEPVCPAGPTVMSQSSYDAAPDLD